MTAVEDKRKECEEKRWRIYKDKNGKDVYIRDMLTKFSDWFEKFRNIGDTVAQYDPAHAAIPWAGLKFLMQVSKSRMSGFEGRGSDLLLDGSKRLSDLWTIYRKHRIGCGDSWSMS